MKKLSVLWLCLALVTGLNQSAHATHFAGGDFNYVCIGPNQYEVTFNWYRDCSGVNAPASIPVEFSSNCSTFTATLPFENQIEVSQLCPSFIANSTCNGGTLTGLEQRFYRDTINIPRCNTSLWTISYGFNNTTCCRNVSNNLQVNGINGPRFRVDATLRNDASLTACNSSPVFNAQPIPFVCVNQTVQYNFGVTDPDGDSLVYSVIDPKPQVANSTFDASYFPDPPYNPTTPLGIASILDPITGQFTFTPTGTMVGNWTLAVQVCEFRNGALIGCITRDIQFVVENCANQTPNAPSSFTNFSGWADSTSQNTITAYPGQDFCIDIVFDDSNVGDTLTLASNVLSVLPGSTVTFNDGTNPATATICWTATSTAPLNNVFVVTANDSACPVSASNSFAMNVIVLPCNGLVGKYRQTEVTCAGACDGTVRVRTFCGTGPYTYNWNPAPAQIFGVGDSVRLCGSSSAYTVLVTDIGSGTSWSTSIAALDPPLITQTGIVTHDDCDTSTCVGAIQVNASGGTGSLDYLWDTGPTSSSISGLCAGQYNLTITDSKGCQDSASYEVYEPIPVTASILGSVDVTCNGGNDGSATADGTFAGCGIGISGCSGPTVLDTIGTGTATNTASTYPTPYGNQSASARHQFLFTAAELQAQGLSAGQINSVSFDVATVGANPSFQNFEIKMGCSSLGNLAFSWETGLVTVLNSTAHIVTTGWNEHTFDVPYVWDGISNVIIEVCFNNGFNINNGNSQTRYTPTTFISSRYFTSNAIAACSSPTSVTAISAFRPNIRLRSCATSVSYAWSPAPAAGQTTPTASNLTAGSYIVSVSSPSGCVDTAHVTIDEPAAVTPTINLDQAISCGGICDAQITASATGGDGGPYTFTWDNGLAAGATQAGLCAGTYNVTAEDGNGCTGTTSITITEPTPVAATITLDQAISCNGVCDAEVTASGSGGDGGPYTFTWDNGLGTGATKTGLCPGTYNVTATDGNGCTGTNSIVISEPPVLSVTASILTAINCNGVCDGELTAAGTGGTAPYNYSWSGGLGTNDTVSNVCAGTYDVTITDANGCTAVDNITISEPSAIVTGHTVNQVISCNGVCDGDVTVTASGGTPNYTFMWPGGLMGANQSGLCAGTYDVTITDANGCTATETVNLTEPAAIAVSINLDQGISCGGICDAQVTASATGGDGGPYTFTWDSGLGTGATKSSLCAGTYNVTATDGNGCTGTTNITITEPAVLSVSATVLTQISCNGICDGELIASVTGGTAPYNYSWSGGLAANDTVSNVCAGTYTVTITDANGCTTTDNVTITEPTALSVNATVITPISCNGVCDGELTASVTGGTAPYNYSWSGGLGANDTVSNVCAGTYDVTITDANGCTAVDNITITEPAAIVTGTTINQAISCNGVCDGDVTVTATGGTPNYTFMWPGGLMGANQTGLCAGTYDVTVTDASGCSVVETVILTEPAAINISIVIDQPVTCGGTCTGQVTASASGGAGAPFQYAWPGGLTGATQTGLCAGTYTVTVTDASGCTDTSSVTLTDPSNLSVAITTLNAISCNGICDGELTAAGTGGTAPYNYSWSGGLGTNDTVSNVCAGSYTVTITDANGCTAIDNVTLSDPAVLAVTASILTPISCNGVCDGELTAAVTGGTTPYTYSWSGGLASNDTVSNVCAGTYDITITDANGCTAVDNITITEPSAIVTGHVVNQVISCNGVCDGDVTVTATGGTPNYTFMWPGGLMGANQTGLCAGTYDVTVTDASGCSVIETVILTEPTAINVTINTVNAISCNGVCDGLLVAEATGGSAPYTFTWTGGVNNDTLANVCAGNYDVTVTDANGCTNTANVTLTSPAALFTIAGPVTPVSCNGTCDGTALVIALGGTTPLTYLWSNGDTTQLADSLCPGLAIVTVTDANGCEDTAQVNMPTAAPFTAAVTTVDASCFNTGDGSATVTLTPPTTGVIYAWSPAPAAGQTTPTASNLTPGSYTVTVTDTITGCIATATGTVGSPPAIVSSTTITQAISCGGTCDGAATVSATGGSGAPYTFTWPGGLTGPSQSNLCAGTYDIIVSDASGCSDTVSLVLTEPAPIVANAAITTISCNGLCDGEAQMNPTGGTAPYTYNWSIGGGGNLRNNLCAGVYFVTISDASGCDTVEQVVITMPAPLDLSLVVDNNPTCASTCDGQITASASGGTAPYTFNWTGGLTGPVQNGLCAGTYTVTVTDLNGCTDIDSVTLTSPPGLTISLNATATIDCNASCTGEITATVNGGTTPYNYAWSVPATGPVVSNLCAGMYRVTVTDVNGCSIIDSLELTEPPAFNVNPTVSLATCGVCDGSIDLSGVSGGAGAPYTFNWNITPSPGNVAVVSNLCAGTYDVTITDANGCPFTQTIPVSSNGGATAANFISTSPTCSNTCDGTSTVVPIGGTLPFTYQWSTGPNDTLVSVNGLCGGIYFVTLTDAAGCIFIASDTILTPVGILNTITVADATCNGVCDGTISIATQLGLPPYSYNWSDGAPDTNARANLCPGQYFVTTTDANGCERIDTIDVLAPPSITATMATTDASCFNTCDGFAQVTPSGGTAPYLYQWSNGSTSDTAQALCVGEAYVTITDVNGCTLIDTALIGAPPAIVIDSTNIIEPTCGASDGSITLVVSGGSGTLTYAWSGGLNGNPLTNIPAGTYTVTITDGSGCSITSSIPVSNANAPALTLAITPASCNGDCTGTASVTVTGGVGPFSYQWSSDVNDTMAMADSLCPGTYFVTVTDQGTGCISIDSGTVVQPTGLNLSLVVQNNTSCNALPVCVGSVTAIASGGTAPYTYQWASSPVTDSSLTSLCGGTYTVTVTSAEGCVSIDSATVLDVPPFTVTIDTVGDASCLTSNDGFINISVQNGVPPFTYSWTGPGFASNSEDISSLLPGSYALSITDQAGCTYEDTLEVGVATQLSVSVTDTSVCVIVDSVELRASASSNFPLTLTWFDENGLPIDTGITATVPFVQGTTTTFLVLAQANGCTVTDTLRVFNGLIPVIDAGMDTAIVAGESIQIGGNPTSNTGGSTYAWSPSTGLSDPGSANPIASPTVTTTYAVLVTNIAGCTGVDSVLVSVSPRFEYPTGFSPNGDGINDFWVLDFLEKYPDCTIQIFNRWGQLLFESEGYREPWDGTYEGQDLPIGTYYYVIDLGREDISEPLTGPVTIMR